MIGSILPISLSGMTNAARRISTSAQNIAEIGAVDPATGVRAVPKRVASTSVEPTGGVSGRVEEESRGPATILSGEVLPAEIDLGEEFVSQQIASYDFKANAKALKTADAMTSSLLDILA